jgi:tetratricopeptide (TPR) repeat protein
LFFGSLGIENLFERWENLLNKNELEQLEAECCSEVDNEASKAQALFYLARINEEKGQSEIAHTFSKELISLVQNEETYMLHGRICFNLNNLQDAITTFSAILDRQPQHVDALYFLSEIKESFYEN